MARRVELYGRLRDAGLGDAVELDLPRGARASEVLALLAGRLGERAGLLAGAVVATDSEVLASGGAVPDGGTLAVLPPVCGG